MTRIVVYALTKKGAYLGKLIAREIEADLFVHERCGFVDGSRGFRNLAQLVKEHFSKYKGLVFVTACGIAVRVIAPLIRSKEDDPAVVVLDQRGRYCISLLGGHVGGANRLAEMIASITGGEAVITTATDTEEIVSVDLLALERGMSIDNMGALKRISGAMLAGEPVQIFDPEERLGLRSVYGGKVQLVNVEEEGKWQPAVPGIRVTWRERTASPGELILHPKCLVAGIGCNRGTSKEEILSLLQCVLNENGLSSKSLRAIATIEAKKAEKGLIDAAAHLGLEVIFFGVEELRKVSVPNPSLSVEHYVGAKSVCEAAAILATGGGKIIVPKTKGKNATIAIALQC